MIFQPQNAWLELAGREDERSGIICSFLFVARRTPEVPLKNSRLSADSAAHVRRFSLDESGRFWEKSSLFKARTHGSNISHVTSLLDSSPYRFEATGDSPERFVPVSLLD